MRQSSLLLIATTLLGSGWSGLSAAADGNWIAQERQQLAAARSAGEAVRQRAESGRELTAASENRQQQHRTEVAAQTIGRQSGERQALVEQQQAQQQAAQQATRDARLSVAGQARDFKNRESDLRTAQQQQRQELRASTQGMSPAERRSQSQALLQQQQAEQAQLKQTASDYRQQTKATVHDAKAQYAKGQLADRRELNQLDRQHAEERASQQAKVASVERQQASAAAVRQEERQRKEEQYSAWRQEEAQQLQQRQQAAQAKR